MPPTEDKHEHIDETLYSKIACIQCRKGHRKCDKLLSGCTYCKKTGKVCSYREAKKRGPVAKDSMGEEHENVSPIPQSNPKKRKIDELALLPSTSAYNGGSLSPNFFNSGSSSSSNSNLGSFSISSSSPIFSSSSSSSASSPTSPPLFQPTVQFNSRINTLTELMSNRTNMHNIMRSYFEVFSMGTPLIDCKQSLELVTQMTSFQQFSLENLGNSSLSLLFLSIQTFCLQRLGHKEVGQQLYQHCLQLLAQQMLSPPDSKDKDRDGNMACALITLAFYLVGEGGSSRDQAKLFLHNCKFYLAQMLQDKSRSNECPYKSRLCAIQKYINLIELVLSQDNLSTSLEVIQRLVSQFDKMCNPLKNAPPLLQLPLNPTVNEQETLEYLMRTSSVVDEIFSQKKTCSQKMNDVLRLTFKLMFDGLRLQMLMLEPEKNYTEMVQLADHITENVNINSDAFASCPTLVIHAVSLAAKVHLKQQNETFLSTPETLEKIERDLSALKLLEKQFNIVSTEHGDQMKEMEKWVQKKQEQQKGTGSLFEEFLSSIDMNDFLEPGFLNSPTVHLSSSSAADHFSFDPQPMSFSPSFQSSVSSDPVTLIPPDTSNQFMHMLIDDVELNDVNYLSELI